MKYTLRLSLLLLALSLFNACSEKDPEPVFVPEVLESTDRLYSRTASEAANFIRLAAPAGALADDITLDITLYSITYKTQYLGQEITASGLVAIPDTQNPLPILSFQNGTNTEEEAAPTNDTSTFGILGGVAGTGFIFCIPDYIGFGSSSELLHPYYHYESTARAVVDMVRAARELAITEGYNVSGDVLLAGYSEGGYATMAAHKYMEDNPDEDLTLVASAPSSGGYDVKGMQNYFFSLEEYDQPYYLAFVALSYQSVYGWTDAITDFFQEPYASAIPGLFDGSLSGGQINAQLTSTISHLIHPDLLANIDTSPDYTYIVDAFEDNSLDDWVPTTRMFLYHGTADITVPYQNSIDTYNRMIGMGTSTSILTFTPLEGANHGTGFFPYLEAAYGEFKQLK